MSVGKEAYIAMKTILEGLMAEDVPKFYDKEVNAAGGRCRKGLAQIAQIVREEKKNILAVRNGRTKK